MSVLRSLLIPYSLLKRDAGVNFKVKGNPTVPILVCNLLNAAFEKESVWPEAFVQLYIEDSLGERIWVDSDDCKPFVEGILTAFGTKMPSRSVAHRFHVSASSFYYDERLTSSVCHHVKY